MAPCTSISYLVTPSCTSNHSLSMNMEIKLQGHKVYGIYSVVDLCCVEMWSSGNNMTDRFDSVLKNPLTAHQHKSITIHCGPADLKYKKLSQQVYVCVCVCVCVMLEHVARLEYTMWHLMQDDTFNMCMWNVYVECVCVCVCAYVIFANML